jgi:hypothetical protein
VSIIALIARPEMFDGQHVRTMGWVCFGFEKSGLFPQQSDEREGLLFNGIGFQIHIEGVDCKRVGGTFDKSYCIIEGDFSAANKGHMSLYSGAITNVCYIVRVR